jgi:hypothetical protein
MFLKTAAALVFISLVGPPISEFNPENYMKEWLKEGHRYADYTSCPAPAERSRKISNSENVQKLCKACRFCYLLSKSVCLYILEKKTSKMNIKALVKKISQL